MTAHEAYTRAVFRLGVWGPEQGRVVGQQVVRLMDQVYGAWARWEAALDSEGPLEAGSPLEGPWSALLLPGGVAAPIRHTGAIGHGTTHSDLRCGGVADVADPWEGGGDAPY